MPGNILCDNPWSFYRNTLTVSSGNLRTFICSFHIRKVYLIAALNRHSHRTLDRDIGAFLLGDVETFLNRHLDGNLERETYSDIVFENFYHLPDGISPWAPGYTVSQGWRLPPVWAPADSPAWAHSRTSDGIRAHCTLSHRRLSTSAHRRSWCCSAQSPGTLCPGQSCRTFCRPSCSSACTAIHLFVCSSFSDVRVTLVPYPGEHWVSRVVV